VTNVKVTVTLTYKGQKFKAHERAVRLTDDDVQISAAGLAYGLIETVWGEVDDDE
jgi:hypothetical protein